MLRVLCIFSLGLCFFACDSGPKPGEEAVYYGEQLSSKDTKEREIAMKKLLSLDDKKQALPALLKVLSQKDQGEIRPEAAQIVAQIGDASVVPTLIEGIDWAAGAGADAKTKNAATTNERIALALGKLAKNDDAKAIEALKRLSLNNSEEVQLAAINALGHLKATAAVPELIDIASGHPNNYMIKNAIIALGNIAHADAVPVLVKNLFFERAGVSFFDEASMALFAVGKPAVPALLEVYKNTYKDIENMHIEPNVQKAKAITVLSDIAPPEAIPLIAEAVDTQGNSVSAMLLRSASQQASMRLGLKEAVKGLLNRYDNTDVSQSRDSLLALTRIGHKNIVPNLVGMSSYAGYTKQCKAQGGNDDTCGKAERTIREPRLNAISLLSSNATEWKKLTEDVKDDKLKKFVETVTPRVTMAAECQGKGIPCFSEKLKDKNAKVRERAVYELVWMNSDDAETHVITALADDDNSVRAAAIWGLMGRLPKNTALADTMKKQLDAEKTKSQYSNINKDLARLEIRVRRGY